MPVSLWRWLLRHRREAREDITSANTEAPRDGPFSTRSSADDLPLPSADESLHFNVGLSLEARWDGNASAPSSASDIAWAGIIRRAEEVSRQHALTATDRLRVELSAALAEWRRVDGTNVFARGQCASTYADEELVAAVAAREETARRHVALSWQSQQRTHQEERMCSVLLDPLRATASWFLDNQDKPEKVVTVAEQFRDLQDILNTATRSESPGRFVDEMLAAADQEERILLVNTLQKMLTKYGREDLSARLDEIETGGTSN